MTPRPLVALAAAAAALSLAGCAGGSTVQSTASAPASSASASSATPAADACALVPADALQAAIGADPGTGEAAKGRIDGGQCTWKVSKTHTVLAQFTRQPDAYLPAGIYKRPKSAHAVEGADRGWASAAGHSVLVVKDGKGVLLTDIEFKTVSQKRFDALAEAIAAKL